MRADPDVYLVTTMKIGAPNDGRKQQPTNNNVMEDNMHQYWSYWESSQSGALYYQQLYNDPISYYHISSLYSVDFICQ
jgi:hypothetical protein